MIRLLLLLIGFCFIVNVAYGQGNLTGRVYENKTRIPVAGISIQNLKSHSATVSDQNGVFSIRAHVGDLILFTGFSYQPDTLYVKDLSNIEIFLIPKQNELNGVTVVGVETNTGNLTAPPTLAPFGGHTLVYQTDAAGNYTGGLTMRLFDSHSGAKKRKANAKIERDEIINQEIDNTFSAGNLEKYLPIRGQELNNFIILYKPDVILYTETSFNLAVYLNYCYTEFLKIPAQKRQSKEFMSLKPKSN